MAESPCSNISIMHLFHELKQKYPAVPDRVVSECIKLNSHDKKACEAILSRENQTYSFPGGRVCKMAVEGSYEPCPRPDSLQLDETTWDVDRRLMGHQVLDTFKCSRGSSQKVCNRYSEEFLNNVKEHQDDRISSAFSRLSTNKESWNSRRIHQQYQESTSSDLVESGEDLCRCERTRVSVVSYSGGLPHSAPVTPSNFPPPLTLDVTTTQRRCTSLNIDPAPHYSGLPEPSRPFTSVNLTLRPPSSDPQMPINISSSASGLTYSSCSYDPRQGYQSRLQISIGSAGQGTVTAARTLAHRTQPLVPSLRAATSMPDVTTTSPDLVLVHLPPATKALVIEQIDRKERLSHELCKYKERLSNMQKEALIMKTDLDNKLKAPPLSFKAKKLQEEIIMLQTECNRMTEEVVHNAEIRNINFELLPLGETNEEFYDNIYRGQLFSCYSARQRVPPPRPPPPATRLGPVVGDSRSWTCHMCTFHNHPDLNKCEQCEMPRMITGADTQNIHIHVSHQNVPSSPYRRVLHSWVV